MDMKQLNHLIASIVGFSTHSMDSKSLNIGIASTIFYFSSIMIKNCNEKLPRKRKLESVFDDANERNGLSKEKRVK